MTQRQLRSASSLGLKFLKWLLIILFLSIFVIFLPVIPVDSIEPEDPDSLSDERVTAEISQSDLEKILRIVRRGEFNSIYEVFYHQTRFPVIKIINSMPSYRSSSSKQWQEISPVGAITVITGDYCGDLCGTGTTYYLEKQKLEWVVVDTRFLIH